jgi:hypothetical protein
VVVVERLSVVSVLDDDDGNEVVDVGVVEVCISEDRLLVKVVVGVEGILDVWDGP